MARSTIRQHLQYTGWRKVGRVVVRQLCGCMHGQSGDCWKFFEGEQVLSVIFFSRASVCASVLEVKKLRAIPADVAAVAAAEADAVTAAAAATGSVVSATRPG